ncbi:ABC transporter transmembrane domain-containing protein [Pseudonocardia sp. GCM10023141]|uniref:ABC transporter transmembrane domain-containing protein n=1 Tax=Pseudonocardia sp. GCM10023141 TaxID=3252653 RepID=UPI00361AAFC7
MHPQFTAGSVMGRALRVRRRDLVVGAALIALLQLSEAAVPVAVGSVIDTAVSTGDPGALVGGLAITAAVFAVLATSGFVGSRLAERAERAAAHEIRMAVAARVLDPAGGAPGRAGELVSIAGSDADRTASICKVITEAGALAALVGGAVVLLNASVLLGVVVLVGVGGVLVASRLLATPLSRRAEAEQESLATATAVAGDLITGLRVLKGIGAERAASRNYRSASSAALRARLASTVTDGVHTGATTFLSGVLLVLVAWLGGRLALTGTITVGQLVAAVGLAQFLLEPLRELTDLTPVLAGARGAAVRVAALLGAPGAVTAGNAALAAGPGALRVQVPDGTAITVAAGEHLGIVTAQATPLIDLLARDVDGLVEVDGTDLRTVTLDDARATVLVARHEAILFEGTVAENVSGPAAGPALAAAAADEIVAELGPDGTLAERGRSLSGGQRQRLTLARALAADAPVLVLQEPTTAIDAATEHRIAEGLAKLRAGRTTVVLTSSPQLLAGCDRVLLMIDGAVAGSGTHAELVADERYREKVLA